MITLQLFKSDLSFHLCSWKNTCIGSEVLLDWTSGIGKRGKLWWRTEWSLYLESSWDFYKTHTIIILTCNSNSETCLLLHHLCLKFTMCTCQSYGLLGGESAQLQCNSLVVTGHCWETEWFSFKAVLVKEKFLTIWCSMNLWWGGGGWCWSKTILTHSSEGKWWNCLKVILLRTGVHVIKGCFLLCILNLILNTYRILHVANPVLVPTALSPPIERYDRVDREINPALELKENLFF